MPEFVTPIHSNTTTPISPLTSPLLGDSALTNCDRVFLPLALGFLALLSRLQVGPPEAEFEAGIYLYTSEMRPQLQASLLGPLLALP